MEQEQLFEGERIITESGDKTVTLTTHRIRSSTSSWGEAHIVSIMLEKISSIEVHYKTYVLLFIIGVFASVIGVVIGLDGQRNNPGMLILICGVACILIYLFTRSHVITIASDGGAKVNFKTKGMKREVVINFINKVEETKSERLKSR